MTDQFIGYTQYAAGTCFAGLRARSPVEVEPELMVGSDVSGALQELIERRQCDLVIVGAHGHSESSRPYGGVTTGLLA